MCNTSDNKTQSEYFYSQALSNWRELPIDFSANEFQQMLENSGKLKKPITRSQLKTAVQNLFYNLDDNPIYQAIYNNQDRSGAGSKTWPKCFYWEITDLIKSLAIAYSGQTREIEEPLAKATIEALVELISEKSVEEVSADYPSQIILQNPTIKRLMVIQFEKDLEKRLRAIWELIHDRTTVDLGPAMTSTLQKLDSILLELLDNTRDDTCSITNAEKSPTTEKPFSYRNTLMALFEELMRSRKSMWKPAQNTNGLYFSLPRNTTNEAIIKGIQDSLDKFSRLNRSELVAPFLEAYKKYLLAHNATPEGIKEVVDFFSNFHELEQYVHRRSTVDTFSKQVTEELRHFVKDTFDRLERADISYQVMCEEVFTSARDAFAYNRLVAAHELIWKALHPSFWLLSTARIIEDISLTETPLTDNPAKERARVSRLDTLNACIDKYNQQLIDSIHNMRKTLHKTYPDTPLLRDLTPETIEEFTLCYNQTCPALYDVSPITQKSILQELSAGYREGKCTSYNQLMIMSVEADLLKMECRMIALTLLDQAVKSLTREHAILDRFQ